MLREWCRPWFDSGMHFLPMSLLWDARHKYVNPCFRSDIKTALMLSSLAFFFLISQMFPEISTNWYLYVKFIVYTFFVYLLKSPIVNHWNLM